jgi:hypothetical protein
MKQNVMQTVRAGLTAKQRNYFKKALLATVAVLATIFTATGAQASCGPTIGVKTAFIKMPNLATAGLSQDDEGAGDAARQHSIVGLWRVTYTETNGTPFSDSLKEWHSDGTEFENVNHNPVVGSVCVGVWKQVGPRDVRLHHMGFLFNAAGDPNGTFTVDETNTVANNGMTYSGKFTFRIYDVNGLYTGTEFTGTVAATRITVN